MELILYLHCQNVPALGDVIFNIFTMYSMYYKTIKFVDNLPHPTLQYPKVKLNKISTKKIRK